MNDVLYRLFLGGVVRVVSMPILSEAIGFGVRVLGRNQRLWTHLRSLEFDGVIDGGANIGEFACLVRRALPKADLACVEPHPPSAARLRDAGFRTIEAALWNERGRLSLKQPDADSTSCTCVGAASTHGTWEVEALPLSAVDVVGDRLLIKLDLQGAELVALAGMGDLWQRTAAILIEMRVGQSGDRAEVEALLRSRGYYDYSTTNELLSGGRVIEADKLWLKEGFEFGVSRR